MEIRVLKLFSLSFPNRQVLEEKKEKILRSNANTHLEKKLKIEYSIQHHNNNNNNHSTIYIYKHAYNNHILDSFFGHHHLHHHCVWIILPAHSLVSFVDIAAHQCPKNNQLPTIQLVDRLMTSCAHMFNVKVLFTYLCLYYFIQIGQSNLTCLKYKNNFFHSGSFFILTTKSRWHINVNINVNNSDNLRTYCIARFVVCLKFFLFFFCFLIIV